MALYRVTDAAVQAAIDLAHSKGLKVMLKPHVDPRDGTNRWQINPSNRAAWFDSYQSMMTHYAAIAQQNGVDEFSVGCELATMSGSADRGAWLTVINAIKAIYSGPLVYAATDRRIPERVILGSARFYRDRCLLPVEHARRQRTYRR